MKRLLLSMTMLFAFAMTSFAQWGPPGGGGLTGGTPSTPDLQEAVGYAITTPASSTQNVGNTFSVGFWVYEPNAANTTSSFTVRLVLYVDTPTTSGYHVSYDVTLPGFNGMQNYVAGTVSFTIPAAYANMRIEPKSLEFDANNNIAERDETNNIVYISSSPYTVLP